MNYFLYTMPDEEKNILEHIPGYLAVFCYSNGEYSLILVSDLLAKVFGGSKDELLSMYLQHKSVFIHPDDVPSIATVMGQVLMEPENPYEIALRVLVPPEKEYKLFKGSISGKRVEKGIVLIYVNIYEITENFDYDRIGNKLTSLDYNTILLDRILNTTQDMIFWKDKSRRFLGANQAFLDYYGFSSLAEIIGKTDEDMGWHPDPEPFKRDEEEVLNGKSTFMIEGECVARGQVRHIRASKGPVYDNGQIIGLVGSFIDITEDYEKTRQINELNDQLEKTNKSMVEFISRMSHEMRTPMNAIIGLATLGLDKTQEELAKEYLKKILFSGQYLLGIINDVLDVRKIEGGEISLDHRPFAFGDVLDAVDTIIKPIAEEKKISFVLDDSKINTWNLIGDKVRIQQILINLLNNAVKFTDEGGKVLLDINQQIQGDNVEMVFVVEDNGCGMSEEFIPKLFNNFAQENRDPSKYGTGTGLGLVISKKFANMMGGDISVESKENVGSRFTVNIVLELGLQDEGIMDTASAWKQHHDDFSILKGARVLLAEDNEINAEVAQGLLDEVGVKVDIARNGQFALDMFRESEEYYYDVILMDVRMPVMDGYEATTRIKELPRMDIIDIPVIAMTADVMEETMQKARESGMSGYVSKPIDVHQFFATLSGFVRDVRKRVNGK
ncbi:MAG: response regulator [Butyrivibrio sp.]|nr:response regulator [Butyrivibrio sp.]